MQAEHLQCKLKAFKCLLALPPSDVKVGLTQKGLRIVLFELFGVVK